MEPALNSLKLCTSAGKRQQDFWIVPLKGIKEAYVSIQKKNQYSKKCFSKWDIMTKMYE